jgi:uncharacterized protein
MGRKQALEKELDIFVEKVRKAYSPEKIIIFGSLTTEKVTENSDLDVIVVAETQDKFWSRMKNISKLCSRKVGMDVLVYTPAEFDNLLSTRTFFKTEIQEKGKVIYEQSKTA